MKSSKQILSWFFMLLSFCWSMNAQQTSSLIGSATVPRLVNFTGKTTDAQGKAIAGIAGVTFAIYKEEFGGSPLWLETQNIQADTKGNYKPAQRQRLPPPMPITRLHRQTLPSPARECLTSFPCGIRPATSSIR